MRLTMPSASIVTSSRRSSLKTSTRSGQYLAASPLHPTSTATSVRVRDGKPLVTDGPFAETREQLGGYFLIDANDLDAAIGIAARIPGARRGTVEIRPVIEMPGLPVAPVRDGASRLIESATVYVGRQRHCSRRSAR